MGQWLKVNGEGIYNTTAWKVQNDTVTPGVWYVSNLSTDYIISTRNRPCNHLKNRAVNCTQHYYANNTTDCISLLNHYAALTGKL